MSVRRPVPQPSGQVASRRMTTCIAVESLLPPHSCRAALRRLLAGAQALAGAVVCCAVLSGCQLPPLGDRTVTEALPLAEARRTPLGRALEPELNRHPGLSGIHPLTDARGAFAARMQLAQAAQRTLDIQYYIWREDLTGTLLLEALHEAADRGVRVRLLLDDLGVSGMDGTLAALDAHEAIEVRLFNPFVVRSFKYLGFLTDFSRSNRRMHNKSFTADGGVTIIGGRNVGDEYFGATDGVLFSDLDVLAVGPAAHDVSDDFDRYWASASAYPAERILPPVPKANLSQLETQAQSIERNPVAAAYVAAIEELRDVQELLERKLKFEWAVTRMVSDDPAKGLGKADIATKLPAQFRKILGEPGRELDLVSPYFVPAITGTRWFSDLAQRGVTVRILTNALEATDVTPVHAGYAKRRVDLLKAGVDLYELRRAPGQENRKEERAGPFGSSGSSLHAKTFAVDANRVFVGSYNFDPRSATFNTEMGFIIDSPELAGRIERVFATSVPQNAYSVRLDEDGNLYWLERRGDEVIRHDTEPNTTWLLRLGIRIMSLLPIEPLL